MNLLLLVVTTCLLSGCSIESSSSGSSSSSSGSCGSGRNRSSNKSRWTILPSSTLLAVGTGRGTAATTTTVASRTTKAITGTIIMVNGRFLWFSSHHFRSVPWWASCTPSLNLQGRPGQSLGRWAWILCHPVRCSLAFPLHTRLQWAH